MKCVLILPYFGNFKNYFELFLKSCEKNPKFDWLIITDNLYPYCYPKNFIIKYMSFGSFREYVQRKFDFPISLDKAYKLCDYKPAYGYIFEEWIKEYDYWGYCDCDLLFGDLTPVLNLLKKGYDKLFTAGHLTIYKNTRENNRIFMSRLDKGNYLYQQAFSNPDIYAFDEVCYAISVHSLFEQEKTKLYEADLSYNCSTKHYNFCRTTYSSSEKRWIEEKTKNDQIYWNDGKLYRLINYQGQVVAQEFIYLHLQMRQMEYDSSLLLYNVIKIEPGHFKQVSCIPLDLKEWKKNKNRLLSIKSVIFEGKKMKGKLKKKINRNVPLKWSSPWEYNPYNKD